jgi:signal peptide peptidase SppA
LDPICGAIEARAKARSTIPGSLSQAKRRAGGFVVLNLFGFISQRGLGWLDAIVPGTSTETFAGWLDEAMRSSADAILINIDSPGGSVSGVGELATKIREARSRKPIIAIANSYAGSAAYWLGSQASVLLVTPGGQVGSIGVFSLHVDSSKAMGDAGLRVSLITSARYKAEGNPYSPLSKEARQNVQREVNAYHKMFAEAVALGRKVPVAKVNGPSFGEGRMKMARPAVSAGMADKIATYGDLVSDPLGFVPSRLLSRTQVANRLIALAERD